MDTTYSVRYREYVEAIWELSDDVEADGTDLEMITFAAERLFVELAPGE